MSHGSVFLTQKLLPSTFSTTPSSDSAAESSSRQVLIRATNGLSKQHRTADPASKVKLSTVVDHAELPTFYLRYAEVCKKGMSEGLRKRDKRKKAKGKSKAKKKIATGGGTSTTGI